jgi:hypothetical protein
MASSATRSHRASLLLLLVGAGVSILWGVSLERGSRNGVMGFPGIYFGTKCLVQGCDPYDLRQLQAVYASAGIADPTDSNAIRQSATLYVNLPTTSLIVAPFALLPFRAAQTMWLALLILSFLLAAYLMWRAGEDYAPKLSVLLTFLLLANCEIIFSGGNTAGPVVALATIAAWCFLRHQFVTVGVLCLAVSLAVKPHDAGLIWLYFLIAGRPQAKRALQSAALALGMTLAACLWVSHVAPHWLPELRSNLATISAPGGINEPGPRSIGVDSPDMIVDLQTVLSIFCDSPRLYNPATYSVCAILLCAWSIVVSRLRLAPRDAWIALAAVAALSMLITYHRSYDVKLFLLLSIPASAILWSEGGVRSWIALFVGSLAAFFSGDIPLTALTHFIRHRPPAAGGFLAKAQEAVMTRPVPLILLSATIFYLIVLWDRAQTRDGDAAH